MADLYPSVKVFQLISGIRQKFEKLHQDIDRILGNIIEDHKQKKMDVKSDGVGAEEDLVDVLLKLQMHGDLAQPLTDNNIKAVILVRTDIYCARLKNLAPYLANLVLKEQEVTYFDNLAPYD